MFSETIKSIVLIMLVISSAILTYLVWSYQPEFSQMDTSIEPSPNIGQSETVPFTNVMRAYQTVWVDGNDARGTIEEEAVVGVREFLEGTEIQDINVYNNMNRLDPAVREDGLEEFLIVDYPSEMPNKSLFQVLGFEYEGTLPDYSFDRIVVDLAADNVTFYLLNESLDRVAVANTDIGSSYLLSILEDYEDSFESYTGLITNQSTSNNKTAIYGPSDPGEMDIQNFLSSQYSVDAMNDILFMDEEISTSQDEEVYVYESESNVATYDSSTYNYSYNNLDESMSSGRNPHQTIQDTFSFLNSHTGLTPEHMLFDYMEDSNESIYRSTLNGHVVFSNEIMSTVSIQYGDNAVFEYERPQIHVDAHVPGDSTKELPTLENVRYQIALNEELDLQNVSKITIGYDLSFAESQTELNLLQFTPEWYVKYDGQWMQFDEGGLQ
ncbi:YycH family regulatory protein [Salinicoccus albus]|uniref:YycH family regulatory protein n=1 Tax=Salinicoccus albus TaxID=418756 RepID=UPI00036A39D3|nr:two-component system activity regulator YycH [Salinicoccus albus]